MCKYEKYIRILGLKKGADIEEIKSAYRKLVKIHHPDFYTNPENKEKATKNFKIITEAFDYLKDNYGNYDDYDSYDEDTDEFQQDDSSTINNDNSNSYTQYKSDSNDMLVKMIKFCIARQIRLKIVYETSSYNGSSKRERIITPEELYLGKELNNNPKYSNYNFDNDKMYLRAYCALRRDYRTFRLDRILYAKIYDEDKKDASQTKSQPVNMETNTAGEENGCWGCFLLIVYIVLFCFLLNIFGS